MSKQKPGDAYRHAGVDIDAGNEFVQAIAPLAAATARAGSGGVLGGFGGAFDLREAGFRDPILIAANDGVGTKLAIAIATGQHRNIGIDLVAMSVNDVIAQGGRPLLFLDYFATARLDIDIAKEVISGIADGCKQAGCALVGGETAEMPDLYRKGDYDLAGFALGACERGALLPRREDIKVGDVLFGLASEGFHANGFSLLRHTLKQHEIKYDAPFPPDETVSIGEMLLRPTRIYVKPLIHAMEKTDAIKSLAHITGGGLLDNIPRALPDNLCAELNLNAWKLPTEMEWFQNLGGWDDHEMARTFNCGIGMVGITSPEGEKKLAESLGVKNGENNCICRIGKIVENRQEQIRLLGGFKEQSI